MAQVSREGFRAAALLYLKDRLVKILQCYLGMDKEHIVGGRPSNGPTLA